LKHNTPKISVNNIDDEQVKKQMYYADNPCSNLFQTFMDLFMNNVINDPKK